MKEKKSLFLISLKAANKLYKLGEKQLQYVVIIYHSWSNTEAQCGAISLIINVQEISPVNITYIH